MHTSARQQFSSEELLDNIMHITANMLSHFRCSLAGCHADSDASGLAKCLALLAQTLPDQAPDSASVFPAVSMSSSSPSPVQPWHQTAGADSASAESSLNESSTGRTDSSSSTAWQSAAENVQLHAQLLRHLCQHGTDTQTQPSQEGDAALMSHQMALQA